MNISDAAFRLETQIALSEDEVHLWRIELATVAKGEQRWEQILSKDERAARFHFPRDRQYFKATRALLRTILGSYVDSDPTELVFRYSDEGKPSLSRGDVRNEVEFNVFHSGDIVLLAFALRRELGVDVEKVREGFDHEGIAARFFSEQEQHQLAALAPTERIWVSFAAGLEKRRTSRRKEAACRFPSTSLTSR